MYRSLFQRDVFSELDRLQREVSGLFDPSPAIRGTARGGYPALNVGTTPTSVEIFAFAPGIDPASIELNLDRGVLTIDGERKATLPTSTPNVGSDKPEGRSTLHSQERFTGRFRRVVSLPDDIDPTAVNAKYIDGVLHVSVKRREAAQPRRITVN